MLDDKTVYAGYGGSKSCGDCHAKEFAEWAESHHALAERAVDPAQDRSAFEPPRTIQHGSQSSEVRFTNDTCEVLTTGLDGQRHAFKAERVIGVLVPDLGVFGAIIYHDIHNHSA